MLIGIIGTESVGKTTLVREIEKRTNYNVLYEYGREYTNGKVIEKMSIQDYININKGHIERFKNMGGTENLGTSGLVLDSETITTMSWCKLMLGIDLDVPILDRCDRYIFLLSEGIEFVQDGTRVLENLRDKHENILINLLKKHDLIQNTSVVSMGDFKDLDERNFYIMRNLL